MSEKPKVWFIQPTSEDEAVLNEVKRHGGHTTTADTVRVALRRYRAQLLREARDAGVDPQPKAGA